MYIPVFICLLRLWAYLFFYHMVHLFNALYLCEPDQRKLNLSDSNSDKTSARARPMSYEMDGRDGNISPSHLTTAVGRVKG